MSRRASTSEPAFGSDSFLDVTANLVGVLIILIVLVGLRVAKTPPRPAAIDAEIERRLATIRGGIGDLSSERLELEQQLASLKQGLSAKQAALVGLAPGDTQNADVARTLAEQFQLEKDKLRGNDAELADARSRLVSLSREFEQTKTGVVATRKLVHRSPLSQRVESDEIHLELSADRVSFIDLAALMERAKGKSKSMEAELRARGRSIAEVGPVGNYRFRFTVGREDMPFTQSLLYGSGSFRARLTEWQVNPVQDPRGEPLEVALQPNSQLDSVLGRYSPNKYAVTIWTYSDSFAAFRRLRDHLSDRGYTVAARPLPLGVPIRGSVLGSRSFAQ